MNIAFFERKSSRSQELAKEFFQQNPLEFLKLYAPHQLKKLKRALSKTKFKFNGDFIVDLLMPANVGGYFAPDQNILAISPYILLQGTEQQIAHILIHEGIHAGVYGPRVLEESLTETMTKKRMAEIYNKSSFKSGYDDLVKEAEFLFGDLSYSEISEKIENGDQETFNNLLEMMINGSSYQEEDVSQLSWDEIYKKLKEKWGVLQKLFPRMMNSLKRKSRGLHEGAADVALSEFKLDDILARSARKILADKPELLDEVFEHISEKLEDFTEIEFSDFKDLLRQHGFLYLLDADEAVVKKAAESFIQKQKVQQVIDNSMKNLESLQVVSLKVV